MGAVTGTPRCGVREVFPAHGDWPTSEFQWERMSDELRLRRFAAATACAAMRKGAVRRGVARLAPPVKRLPRPTAGLASDVD